jgi:CheY-like chemotaxis protein
VSSPFPSILIVDDDPDIREALLDVLSDHGYRAQALSNGREALDYLRSGARPRLILLDLMMPQMDGLQFRHEQLRDPELCELPVLLISADTDIGASARALGITHSMRKPLDLDALLEVVVEHGC